MQDLTEEFNTVLEEIDKMTEKAFNKYELTGSIVKEKVRSRDPFWSCYGSLALHEEPEELEEDIDWIIRDIRSHFGGFTRSSALSLAFRALDTEGNREPDLYVFYSLMSKYNLPEK